MTAERTLPNFLIVGAAKCGTTSLFHYLGQHPDVFVPTVKEPCYFSAGKPVVARSDDEYAALFAGGQHSAARGEASTSYLYDSQAPARIAALLGRPRIFILLRNPADRAYASWAHNTYQIGWEDLPFEAALQAECERVESQRFVDDCPYYHGGYHYFRAGQYAAQVRRYFEAFGHDGVRVFITEEFGRDAAAACRASFEFLGLDETFAPDLSRQNVAPGFRNATLHRLLSRPPAAAQRVVMALPMRLRMGVYRAAQSLYWRNQTHRPRPKLAPAIREQLLARYEADIAELEALLDRSLDLWREPRPEPSQDQ